MSDDEVQRLAFGWMGGEIAAVTPFAGGQANQTYLLALAGGRRLVFRWYEVHVSPMQSEASIGYEHAVLGRMAARGMPVPVPQMRAGRICAISAVRKQSTTLREPTADGGWPILRARLPRQGLQPRVAGRSDRCGLCASTSRSGRFC